MTCKSKQSSPAPKTLPAYGGQGKDLQRAHPHQLTSYASKLSTNDTNVTSQDTNLSAGLTMISQTCHPARLHYLTTNCLLT